MKLKTISKAIAGLALAAGVAGSASAFTITVGSYKMTMDSYDAGTLYGASCGSSAATPADVAACDLAGLPNVGTTLGSDSWGIFSVSSITNTTTNTQEFTRVTDGYLIGTFGGTIDYKVDTFGAFQQAFSSGGVIKFYKSATDYDPSFGPSANTDAAIFANLAGANPVWLEAKFEPAADVAEQNSGYQNLFSGSSLTGSGSGYLSYISGTALTQFNTDTLATLLFPFGTGIADAVFTTTVKPITSPTDLGFGKGWLVKNSADNEGYAIPEPGSMALVGLGLMGLAGLRRRKQQA